MKIPHWLKRSMPPEEHLDSGSIVRKMLYSNPDILVLEDNRVKFRRDFVRVDQTEKRYYRSWFESPRTVVSEYEYRIEGTKVLARLIEEFEDEPGIGSRHWVKDNVVLESEIPESELCREITVESYREEVEWHEPFPSVVKYFILSRHTEAASDFELRRFFRQELERIKVGIDALVKKAAEVGAELYETPDGHYELRFSGDAEKSDCPAHDEHRENIHNFYEQSLDACRISFHEFYEGKKLTAFLQGLLEQTVNTI